MIKQQKTEDEINSWAVDRYTSRAAPSLSAAVAAPAPAAPASSGMLGASTTPTAVAGPAAPAAASTPASSASTWAAAAAPSTTPSATPAASAPSTASTMAAATSAPAAPKPYVDINSWYRNELGRNGDAAGIAFWQQALDSGRDPQDLYRDFTAAAMRNNENVKPVDWASANNAVALPPAPAPAPAPVTATNPSGVPQISRDELTTRTIDKPTETVQGQIGNLLAENSPVLQQARADAMRTAADRGMLNSAMAASGGEDAVVRSAASIGTTDAGAYNNAANYNAAAQNQATMWNADQVAQMQRLEKQQAADAAARAQQMAIAQMQDATSRYQSEMSANTSKYNTDASYRQQMDSQKQSLANNIIANMDLSPDRKAALLEALGLGTSASTGPDGSFTPGTGLAGAVYVIGSTTTDLVDDQHRAQAGADSMIAALG